jgi:hypothetical protein
VKPTPLGEKEKMYAQGSFAASVFAFNQKWTNGLAPPANAFDRANVQHPLWLVVLGQRRPFREFSGCCANHETLGVRLAQPTVKKGQPGDLTSSCQA